MNLLGAKVETVVGTSVYSSMDETNTLFHVFNVNVSTEIPFTRRTLQGSLSNITSVHGPRARRVTFSLHVYGLGSAGLPIWASTFLPSVGLKEVGASFKYVPSSLQSEHESLSLVVYQDGKALKLRGCRGNVEFVFTHGNPIEARFSYDGVYDDEVDVATPSGQSWPLIVPPRVGSSTVTLGAYTPVISSMSISTRNTVELRPGFNDDAYISALIVDRDFGGTIDPEDTTIATNDFYNQMTAHTEQALSIAVGTAQYNKVLFEAPAFQLNTLTETQRQGMNALQTTFSLNASLSAGTDNEIAITFPQTA